MKAILSLTFVVAILSTQAHFLGEVRDIEWPFTNCGTTNDDLDVTQVTLANTPAKGTGAGITIVLILFGKYFNCLVWYC